LKIGRRQFKYVAVNMNWFARLATVTGILIVISGCKSAAPVGGPDPNLAGVTTGGLRLGMTPTEVLDLSERRLYKEDQRNQDRLVDLAQKEKEKSTIRLERVRSLTSSEMHSFYSNAVTLTLQFARNRLVQIEERHTGLGEADVRAQMRELAPTFKFATDRTEAGSGARWAYQGKDPNAFARVDFRFVPITPGKSAPQSSYTIVVADPAWATTSTRGP
jgi:hypothetical protein